MKNDVPVSAPFGAKWGDAFTQWGCPRVIRTDRDRRLVATGDYSVPMFFTLWLVGLGIRHETTRRLTQNGQVERSYRTWEDRLLYPPPADTIPEFREWVNYQVWRMNAILPSRARNCRRYPPLLAYPQARHNPRHFSRQEELPIFDMERVYDFLSQGHWLRRVSTQGQFSFQSDLLAVCWRENDVPVSLPFAVECGTTNPPWPKTVFKCSPKGC